MISVVIILLTIVIVVGFLISRAITEPISILVQATKAVALGQLDIKSINIDTGDEFDELAASFGTMTKKLKKRDDEVTFANKQLKENEQKLKMSVIKTEAAAQAKSKFLANMSHEIRDSDECDCGIF